MELIEKILEQQKQYKQRLIELEEQTKNEVLTYFTDKQINEVKEILAIPECPKYSTFDVLVQGEIALSIYSEDLYGDSAELYVQITERGIIVDDFCTQFDANYPNWNQENFIKALQVLGFDKALIIFNERSNNF